MKKSIYSILILGSVILFITISVNSSKFMMGVDSNGRNHSGIGALSPGQSIKIHCSYTDNIKWSKTNINTNSTNILVSKDNILINKNELKINKIGFNDSGLYYCEQNSIAYQFNLFVFTIAKITNGTVPTTFLTNEINGIHFNSSKLTERTSANVSCFCENASNKTKLNIIWQGGLYDKSSDLYTIETHNPPTGINSTLILRKTVNNRKLYGEYTCSCNVLTDANVDSKVYMEVVPIFDDYNESVRVNEGEDVVLRCSAWAYPDIDNSSLKWSFQNNFTLRDNVNVVWNGPGSMELLIRKVTSANRGVYTCHATNTIGSNTASTMLRIKGRYAVMWPFLGIVIQIAILIAIIVIYEWNKMQNPKDNNLVTKTDSRYEMDTPISERCDQSETLRQRLVKV